MEIIKEIGAYAGLAAVVGLAVLSALYFSQARDLKRLREWAGRAPERASEQAVQQAAAPAGRVVAQPKPGATPARPAPAQAAAAGATPAAAAAKPAAAKPAAATPAAATPAGQKQAAPGEQAKPAAQPAPAADGAAKQGGDKPGLQPAGAQAQAGQASPGAKEAPPTPAGAGAVGAGDQAKSGASPAGAAASPPAGGETKPSTQPGQATQPRPDGETPAARATTPPPPVPSGGGQGRPRFPSRAGASGRPAPSETAILTPPRRDPWYSRLLANPRYLTVAIAGILIVGGGAAYGVTQLGKNEGPTTSDNGGRFAPSGGDQKPKRRGAPINPATVTVSVLNGTTVPGLAAQIGDSIESFGFQLGNVTNSSDQQRAESVVLFRSGHEREAAAVGRKLRIGQREPIDAQTQALAGDATVVVIVGADKTP
ncbi:MAG: LytR C-terminal domain-containing protein [Thermoleophilaceae bacterium]